MVNESYHGLECLAQRVFRPYGSFSFGFLHLSFGFLVRGISITRHLCFAFSFFFWLYFATQINGLRFDRMDTCIFELVTCLSLLHSFGSGTNNNTKPGERGQAKKKTDNKMFPMFFFNSVALVPSSSV